MAVAHRILIVAYQMLRKGEDYQERGGNYFDRQNRSRVATRLVSRLTSLGYHISLQPAPTVAPVADPSDGAERAAPTPVETPPPRAARRPPGRPCKCAIRGITCTHKTRA